jgi:hypothetical protein
VPGQLRDVAELDRLFYAWRFERPVNRSGYVRFRQWLIYGERGWAEDKVMVGLYNENLTIEFAEEPLAQYEVAYQPDHKHPREIKPSKLFETRYQSPQLMLWTREQVEWRLVQRLTVYPRQPRRTPTAVQLPLFPAEAVAT